MEDDFNTADAIEILFLLRFHLPHQLLVERRCHGGFPVIGIADILHGAINQVLQGLLADLRCSRRQNVLETPAKMILQGGFFQLLQIVDLFHVVGLIQGAHGFDQIVVAGLISFFSPGAGPEVFRSVLVSDHSANQRETDVFGVIKEVFQVFQYGLLRFFRSGQIGCFQRRFHLPALEQLPNMDGGGDVSAVITHGHKDQLGLLYAVPVFLELRIEVGKEAVVAPVIAQEENVMAGIIPIKASEIPQQFRRLLLQSSAGAAVQIEDVELEPVAVKLEDPCGIFQQCGAMPAEAENGDAHCAILRLCLFVDRFVMGFQQIPDSQLHHIHTADTEAAFQRCVLQHTGKVSPGSFLM